MSEEQFNLKNIVEYSNPLDFLIICREQRQKCRDKTAWIAYSSDVVSPLKIK